MLTSGRCRRPPPRRDVGDKLLRGLPLRRRGSSLTGGGTRAGIPLLAPGAARTSTGAAAPIPIAAAAAAAAFDTLFGWIARGLLRAVASMPGRTALLAMLPASAGRPISRRLVLQGRGGALCANTIAAPAVRRDSSRLALRGGGRPGLRGMHSGRGGSWAVPAAAGRALSSALASLPAVAGPAGESTAGGTSVTTAVPEADGVDAEASLLGWAGTGSSGLMTASAGRGASAVSVAPITRFGGVQFSVAGRCPHLLRTFAPSSDQRNGRVSPPAAWSAAAPRGPPPLTRSASQTQRRERCLPEAKSQRLERTASHEGHGGSRLVGSYATV